MREALTARFIPKGNPEPPCVRRVKDIDSHAFSLLYSWIVSLPALIIKPPFNMKKLLIITWVVLFFVAAGCENDRDEPLDNPTNPESPSYNPANPNNEKLQPFEIRYTSTDGTKVLPSTSNMAFGHGFKIVSNTYYNGIGTIIFDGDITKIGQKAFYNCSNLANISYPDNVKTIDSSAFSGCSNLEKIRINDNVISIGDEAFRNCKSLASVHIGNGVTSIGDYTFYGCSSLASAHIGNGVTSIGDYAFDGCGSLASVHIGNGVTSIGSRAFYECKNLSKVEFASVESLCKIQFKSYYSNPMSNGANLWIGGKEIRELVIPNTVTSIGDCTFCGCIGLTSVTISDNVTSIGVSAFYDCNGLTSVTIPDNVTSIGDYAFTDCSSLESVTIGKNVTNIGKYAFCTLESNGYWDVNTHIIETMYFRGSTPPELFCPSGYFPTYQKYSHYIFPFYANTIYVPRGSVEAYREATKFTYEPAGQVFSCANNIKPYDFH